MPERQPITEQPHPTPGSERLLICGVCKKRLPHHGAEGRKARGFNAYVHPYHSNADMAPIRRRLDELAFPIVLHLTQRLVAEAFARP